MSSNKPHAVLIPYPAQGHINPMLKLAKLLNQTGFHVTFVNTEYNHNRLLRARGAHALDGAASFQFRSIPDGLPEADGDATQDVPALSRSTSTACLGPFRDLLKEINGGGGGVPPVSCVVSDGAMSFAVEAGNELGIPVVFFWPTSGCAFLGYYHYRNLVDKGLVPLKDESMLTNGYLDTEIDWIPGLQGIRLKDIPTFIRTTDPHDTMLNFILQEIQRLPKASALILHTFEALEHRALSALSSLLPIPVFPIGPLHLMTKSIDNDELRSIRSNLWKEDSQCLSWLDSKQPNSVLYVNFGSVAVMTNDQLIEFAWGLANSKKEFLWVVRPDLVAGDTAVLPAEFVAETKDRSFLTKWCPQEEVLSHAAVGGFLTHSGWNSVVESLAAGVPVICWRCFADQQMNCRYCCTEWGVGMEIDGDAKREEIERVVIELTEGEKGREMKRRAAEWKRLAGEAAEGSSRRNLERLISDVLLF